MITWNNFDWFALLSIALWGVVQCLHCSLKSGTAGPFC